MKGNSNDDVVDAAINHGVSMHGQDARVLRSPEGRVKIAEKIKEE